MTEETDAARAFFSGYDVEYTLYQQVIGILRSRYPDMSVRVQKTQITLRLGVRSLCALWLPIRKIKCRPSHYLVLTFWLRRRVEDDRIVEIAEPYPGRFTHHVLLDVAEALDERVLGWLDEAAKMVGRIE